jgi:hypothetical protein
MNAMLEARIVAARIHGDAAGALGEAHGAARMTPLSEGRTQKSFTAVQDQSN